MAVNNSSTEFWSTDQDREGLASGRVVRMEGLDGAFRHFGGLTEQVLCDNASLWPHSRFSARVPGWPPPRMGKEKMAENGAFSRAKSAIFPCLVPGVLDTSHWLGCFYVGWLFWRPRARENVGPFSGELLFRRDAQRPFMRATWLRSSRSRIAFETGRLRFPSRVMVRCPFTDPPTSDVPGDSNIEFRPANAERYS